MTNNLNQIESDLYRLGVDAEGDVPEMVAELKEAYRKAAAFDEVLKSFDKSFSESHMADDVYNIIDKFRSESE